MKIRFAKKFLKTNCGHPGQRVIAEVRRSRGMRRYYDNLRKQWWYKEAPDGYFDLRGHVVLYQPYAGIAVEQSCRVIAAALGTYKKIRFDFNGFEYIAKRGDTAPTLYAAFLEYLDQKQQAYLKSPAHQESLRQDQINRDETVRLLSELPSLVADLDRLLDWLCQFEVHALAEGRSADEYKPAEVAAILLAAGYVSNEFARHEYDKQNSNPPMEHLLARLQHRVLADPEALGRYIVGQAINCFLNGMPPHQLTHRFVQQYKQLKASQ